MLSEFSLSCVNHVAGTSSGLSKKQNCHCPSKESVLEPAIPARALSSPRNDRRGACAGRRLISEHLGFSQSRDGPGHKISMARSVMIETLLGTGTAKTSSSHAQIGKGRFLSWSLAILWARCKRLPEGIVVAVPPSHFTDAMTPNKAIGLACHIILNGFKRSEFTRRRTLE